MSIGKLIRKSLPFSNVVASGVASAPITHGRTIERIVLALGGTSFTKSNIALIKLKANGKVFMEVTGDQADKMQTFRGITASAAFLVLDFTEIRGRDLADQLIGGFDTSVGIQSLTMEVTISGATAPTLEAWTIESQPQPAEVAGLMTKVLRYPFSVAAGGVLPIPLPFGQSGAVIKRLHLESSAGQVDEVTIKQDGLVVFEATKALNDYMNTEHGRSNQTNWFSVDFIRDGNQRNAFDVRSARSLELLPKFSAACTGFVLAEYYDVLGNL